MRYVGAMKTPQDLYADADRVEVTDDDGTVTWVVLAEDRIAGASYVLAADDADLSSDVEDMNVAVFATSGQGRGRRLTVIEDDATEERVFQHFAELMGFAD